MLLATAATESNFQNTFKSFGIEASPVAFDILSSRLYSNTTLAIVREILSNAYDAMAEAGTLDSKKIEVHFPDMMESRFIVRDYGNGLSEEEVFNLYTTFFKSTKRDSNEFTGCYGLGSKSPFAYGDSFMVESFQNGISKKYLMAKMNGYPKVTKIGEKETAEDNGLKITIPVPEGDKDFYYEFCKYVKYQPDLGKVIEANASVEYVEFFKEYEDNFCKVKLVMDNSSYRNSCPYIKQGMNIFQLKEDISLYGFTAVVEVPIGTFEIVPSREALSESESNKRKFIIVRNSVQKLMSNILNEFEPHSMFVFNSYLHEPIAEALRKKYFPTKSFLSTYSYYRDSSSIDVQKSYKDRSMHKIAYTGYIAGLFEIKSYVKDYFSLSESSVRDDIPMIIVVGKGNDPDWGKVKRKMSTYPDFKDMNIYVKGFSYDRWLNHPNSSEYPICPHALTKGIPCATGIEPREAIQYLKNIVWTYNSIPELNFDIQIMPIKTFLRKFKSAAAKRKTPSAPVNTLIGVIEMSTYNNAYPTYFRDSTLEKQVDYWNVIGVALKKDCPHLEDLRALMFLFNRRIINSKGNIAVDEALANQGINVRGINDVNSKHHVLFLSSRGYRQALDMGLKPLDFSKLIKDVKAMSISMYIKSRAVDISELNFVSKLFTEDHEIRKQRGIKLHLSLIRKLKSSYIYKMHEMYLSFIEKIARNTLDGMYDSMTELMERFFNDSPTVRICEYRNIAILPRLAKFYNYFSERRSSYRFPSKEDQYRIANFILNNKNHL